MFRYITHFGNEHDGWTDRRTLHNGTVLCDKNPGAAQDFKILTSYIT